MEWTEFLLFVNSTPEFPHQEASTIVMNLTSDKFFKLNETFPYEWVLDETVTNNYIKVESRFESLNNTPPVNGTVGIRLIDIKPLQKGSATIRFAYCEISKNKTFFEDAQGPKVSATVKIQ